jgi:hypothetical protein
MKERDFLSIQIEGKRGERREGSGLHNQGGLAEERDHVRVGNEPEFMARDGPGHLVKKGEREGERSPPQPAGDRREADACSVEQFSPSAGKVNAPTRPLNGHHPAEDLRWPDRVIVVP